MSNPLYNQDSAIDRQGIRRGMCLQCSCQSYSSKEGLMCKSCHHPPTKHTNLSSSGSRKTLTTKLALLPNRHHHHHHTMATTVPYSLSTHDSGPKQVASSSMSPSHTPPHSSLFTSPVTTTTSSASSSSSSPYYQSWPQCKANDCSNRVFHSEGLGYFDYCSPKCRDEHCLPKYNIALDKDIMDHTPSPQLTAKTEPSPLSLSSPSLSKDPDPHRIVSLSSQSSSNNDYCRYRKVTVKLEPKESLGLILKDEDKSVIIVGMDSSKSLRWLREGRLFLLDAIESVNDETLSSSEISNYASSRTEIHFLIDQKSRAITSQTKSFYVKLKECKISKIFCTRASLNFLDCGFLIDEKCAVNVVISNSEAERFGLRKGDILKIVAVLRDNQIHKVIPVQSKSILESEMKKISKRFDYIVVGF